MAGPFKYFPSHAFRHGQHHVAFKDLLESGAPRGVTCHSLAPTSEHPIHAGADNIFLANALMRRIQKSDVFFALAGVYASHSKWMNFEITTAAVLGKPIIAVAPNGQERLSSAVMQHVDGEAVRWRAESVWAAVCDALPAARWSALTAPRFVRL